MGMNLEEKIGQRLQKAREKKHITQKQMAEMCGHTQNYISAIERGVNKASLHTIYEYYRILDITPNEIFGLNENSDIIPGLYHELLELDNDQQKKLTECLKILKNNP